MIFKRKKSDRSSISIGDDINEKITSKAETLYVGVMCFAAACLSFMALEVGAKSPLGQSVTKSTTFNAIFRRSYNMKIKIMITNVVMGLITTIMLALGDIYGIPYLYVPWLFNTMRGMIFCEGPTLLGLSQAWIPDAGIPAGLFIFITSLLFVEELCLWFDVFGSFKNSWKEYDDRKTQEVVIKIDDLPTEKFYKGVEDPKKIGALVAPKLKLRDDNDGSIVNTAIVATPKSTSSNENIRLRSTRSANNSKSCSSC